MKKITLLFILLITCNLSSFAQTTLNPGDIAITGFNADTEDEFTFVLLRDIESGTTINFTDNGWQTSGSFRPGNFEGILTWVTTTDLPCATEINILSNEDTVEDTYIASIGTVTESEDGFALATNGDHILAYQGPATSPSFIFGIHFASDTSWSDAIDFNTSAVPAGLVDGATAVYVGDFDNSTYNCSVTSNKSLILAAITTPSNWNGSNSRISPLGGCRYCANISTWDGSSWSNGVPDLNTAAVIDGNYNTISNGNISACSLIVNSGTTFVVGNNTFAEVENNVTVDGELSVQSQGNFVQNDNEGIFTNNGTSTVTKNTPVKGDWFFYTYWSSPVENETIGNVFSDVDGDRRFFFNANNYLDTDGNNIDDNGDDWQFALAGDVMTPGVGYAATSSRLGIYPASVSEDFRGAFNTGAVSTPIAFNPANIAESWNFIGNPYPSAIDFNAFHAANSSVIAGTAYFWSQATPPDTSNPGNQQSNFSQNDYATYAVGMRDGTAGASGERPTQFIPSAQGFFVSGLTDGNVTFTNAMRSTLITSNSQFFKQSFSKNTVTENKLWLNLTTDNGVFSQILVGYVEGATRGDDGSSFDASRFIGPSTFAALYSLIDQDEDRYVIQGRALNDISTEEVIRIGFVNNIRTPLTYRFSIAQIEGAFLNGNDVYLRDNLLDITHNLSHLDYTFTSENGEFDSRFEIVFASSNTLNTQTVDAKDGITITYANDNTFSVLTSTSTITSLDLYDLQGKKVKRFTTQENKLDVATNTLKSGVYLSKITLSDKRTVIKRIIVK